MEHQTKREEKIVTMKKNPAAGNRESKAVYAQAEDNSKITIRRGGKAGVSMEGNEATNMTGYRAVDGATVDITESGHSSFTIDNKRRSTEKNKQEDSTSDIGSEVGAQGRAIYTEATDKSIIKIDRKDHAQIHIKSDDAHVLMADKFAQITITEDDDVKTTINNGSQESAESQTSEGSESIGTIQTGSEGERKIPIEIRIVEKRAVMRGSFLSSQKLSDLRQFVEKEHEDLSFAIFNSKEEKLDESKTFKEHGIEKNGVLKLGNEELVRSYSRNQRCKN